MRADAGTDVVVDLLFFQAREPGTEAGGPQFLEVAEVLSALDEHTPATAINRYFLDHPAMVLGRHERTSSAFGSVYTCTGSLGPALEALLAERIAALPKAIDTPAPLPAALPPREESAGSVANTAGADNLREGSYLVLHNRLRQVVNGVPTEVAIRSGKGRGIPRRHAQVIIAMIPIRDAVREILRAQEMDRPYREAQFRLRSAYTGFVRDYGPINRTEIVTAGDEETGEVREIVRRPNLAILADDPDVWLVSSIEEYDPETRTARPGPIFDQRVIRPPAEPIVVTAADALSVSLHECGRVDPETIAELLGRPWEEIEAELAGLIFRDPENGHLETADAYLSGPVRDKFARAEEAAERDPRYAGNVAALQSVQPADLKPSEITARLGAPWIPAEVIASFAAEVLGVETKVSHTPAIAHWSIDEAAFLASADSRTRWGTGRRHAGELLSDALNARIPQIWDVLIEDGKERRELNAEETEAAKEKLAAIRAAFQDWVWTDSERAERLAGIYNARFNNLVPRHFDGSHLALPGASSVIAFYPHQKRVIWRIIAAGSTYIAHAVGAGKTYAMAAAVMEQKRLGLITKAMMVVPGHCLVQQAREFLQLYPTARILVADETNFAKPRRRQFLARAATAEWDCIIITHFAFRFIPVSREFEREMIAAEISALEQLLTSIEGEDRMARKRIEKIKEGFEAKLESLATDKDDLVTLGEIGIDQLIVDEAQEFRRLVFATNMGTLKGIDPDGSQRAWDLFVKTRFVETLNPGRALIMASGTPITNTMGELFTLQRFFAPDLLRERSIHSFDAWAANFGECRTELELQPSGLYKPVTRFSEFVNVPELIDIFRHFADVMPKGELRQNLRLPRIAGGKRRIITTEPTRAFRAYQRVLDQRIRAIEARNGRARKGDDILLSVITDGRHAAIDLRLAVPGFAGEPGSKLDLMIDNIHAIYRRTSETAYYAAEGVPYVLPGAVQLVFSDLGTPNVEVKRGFSAYRWIREELIRRGVPGNEIAFMQDYRKATQKQALFADVNAGRVRILIGSTATMGTGVNVQKRLKAIHHLDVPWLPSDIEQREGRGERQGNQNEEIEIYAYATLTSMDATLWQANERKQRFIEAALSGDRSIRRLEDAGSQANQFALAKAIASGDQRLMQKAGLEAEIARLERLRAAHLDNQLMVRRTVADAREMLARAEARIGQIDADLARRTPTRGEAFRMIVGGRCYDQRKPAGGALLRSIAEAGWSGQDERIGEIGGFGLRVAAVRDERRRPIRLFLLLERTGQRQRIEVPDAPTALGIIARLESALDRFEIERAEWTEKHEKAARRLADYEPRIGQAFEFEGELEAKRNELVAVEVELAGTAIGEGRGGEAEEADARAAFEAEFGIVAPFPGRGERDGQEAVGTNDAATATTEGLPPGAG